MSTLPKIAKAIVAGVAAFGTPLVTDVSVHGSVHLYDWIAAIIAGLTAFQTTYWVPNKAG